MPGKVHVVFQFSDSQLEFWVNPETCLVDCADLSNRLSLLKIQLTTPDGSKWIWEERRLIERILADRHRSARMGY